MAQKLCIPNLGTLMILAEDWTFKLYFEDRNTTLLQVFGLKKNWGRWHRGLKYNDPENDATVHSLDFEDGEIPSTVEYEKAMTEEELAVSYKSFAATNSEDNPFIRVTLPKGTQLKVDRIYVRAGAQSFASVTFRTTKICPDKRFTSKRFWVKLREANEIVADIIG